MAQSFDVVVCGSLHLDIVVSAPSLPRIDETAVGSSWKQVCGGKGGNQAVQAARAGARTAMIGRIGDDDFGKTLLANLMAENVDARWISIDAMVGTGMSVAISQADGEYGAVIVSGSNLKMEPAALKTAWAELGGGKVLVLQNEVPHAVNVAMARMAKASGSLVVTNAAPARDMGDDLLDLVDVLIVNRVEAEAMAGLVVRDRTSARIAATLLAGPRRSVIITLGGEGIVVCPVSGETAEILPVPVRVTSTHGAGDCFAGTLCASLALGRDLVEACRTANDVAAAFVSRPV